MDYVTFMCLKSGVQALIKSLDPHQDEYPTMHRSKDGWIQCLDVCNLPVEQSIMRGL